MKRNPHYRILKSEPKKQHLSTISKSCSYSIHLRGHERNYLSEREREREREIIFHSQISDGYINYTFCLHNIRSYNI